jgi:hypothetical protein
MNGRLLASAQAAQGHRSGSNELARSAFVSAFSTRAIVVLRAAENLSNLISAMGRKRLSRFCRDPIRGTAASDLNTVFFERAKTIPPLTYSR